MRRLAVIGALLGLAMVVAGCGPPRYELSIYNVDAGPVFVTVNGAGVGRLMCGDPPIVMVPNLSTPKLPWRVEVVADGADGAAGTWAPIVLDGKGPADQALLIRADALVAVPPADPRTAGGGPVRRECAGVDPGRLPGGSPEP